MAQIQRRAGIGSQNNTHYTRYAHHGPQEEEVEAIHKTTKSSSNIEPERHNCDLVKYCRDIKTKVKSRQDNATSYRTGA